MAVIAFFVACLLQSEAARLVEQMGSEVPSERDEAEAGLLKLGIEAYSAIREAANSRDAEIRDRAERLLVKPPFQAEEAARGRYELLAGEQWVEAVEKLLNRGWDKLKTSLGRALETLGPVAKFRAQQVLDIISRDPQEGLIYGIVLESSDALQGLEIWINATDRPITFEALPGLQCLTCINDLDEEVPMFGGIRGNGRKYKFVSFSVPPRRAKVIFRPEFNTSPTRLGFVTQTLRSGHFSIFTTYESLPPADATRTPERLWTGKIRSNVVEFRYAKR